MLGPIGAVPDPKLEGEPDRRCELLEVMFSFRSRAGLATVHHLGPPWRGGFRRDEEIRPRSSWQRPRGYGSAGCRGRNLRGDLTGVREVW